MGALCFLIDLFGDYFRPGAWNTRGPSTANNKKGTSGVCCQARAQWAVGATLLPSSLPPGPGVEMSGLSSSEMEGCRNLLGLLDNDEIMALCDTVTNRLVQPEDRQGKGGPFP